MNQGIKTIIYPVKDLEKSKALFTALLGIDPYTATPYYVGYRIGDQEIGLDPNGHQFGMTCYYEVDDISQSVQDLQNTGAQILNNIQDVGGGKLTAVLQDANNNIIGFIQSPRDPGS